MGQFKLLKRIGPAFVVGACIIGPGSVTTMSKAGSLYGYSMLWLAVLSGVLMCLFLAFFMRLGIYSDETFLDITRRKTNKWFAALCGLSLASTDVAFQFGNCLGVTIGMSILFPAVPSIVWPFLFTFAAIIFMFSFKNIYKVVEKLMAFFLVLMLLAFMINLIFARPELGKMAKGFLVPGIPDKPDWILLTGLVGTTFCLVAVIFQAYVVKAKGWGEHDLSKGLFDTISASIIVTILGCVMMMTAAAILLPRGIVVTTPEDLARQLEEALGSAGKIIFGIGFCAAAFSSFITNSMIGGTLLNDSFIMGGRVNSKASKVFASLILLVGLGTSLGIILSPEASAGDVKVIAITIAQAFTVLAIPLGAVATVLVLLDKRAVKDRALPSWAKGVVCLGVVVLVALSVRVSFVLYDLLFA